ncbi:hypothetical protein [Thioalkalivibrio sp. HL-Eb18]|uniref:hypothetical protein n=1 Tax=Thioalkalivibrio sp. HL-Eb18 TaxID=1266913 RepID=UPI000375C76A|nr:hypothetical protein [Thioalkalivibrio sp. HL-Eb18]
MAKNSGNPLNLRELSELTGKGFRTIRAALENLEPMEDRGRGGIFYDSREALPLIYNGGGADDSDGDLVLARERALLAKAQRERIELQTAAESGRLVDKAKAKRLAAELAMAQSKPWTQWPARVYAEMAAELGVDGVKLHQVLDEHVRRQLEAVATAPMHAAKGGAELSPPWNGEDDEVLDDDDEPEL